MASFPQKKMLTTVLKFYNSKQFKVMVSNPKNQIEAITPSKLLPNQVEQFFKSLFLGQIKEQYADRFGDQPYSLRNRKKYEFAYYVSYAPSNSF